MAKTAEVLNMRYWIVIHDRSAFLEEPGFIGKETRLKGKINKIEKGDKILYYSRGESVVINSFDVTSAGSERAFPCDPRRRAWKGSLWCYRIRVRGGRREVNVPVHDLIEQLRLKIFPDRKSLRHRLWNRTAVQITKSDFHKIEAFMRSYQPNMTSLFRGPANEGNLGEPMDLEILNYAPTSEQGVVVLFAIFMTRLRYDFVKMEFIRSGFPDACVIQRNGGTYSRRYVEFEFKASGFRQHERNKKHKELKCDFVVCWENDHPACPIPVIELKSLLPSLLKIAA